MVALFTVIAHAYYREAFLQQHLVIISQVTGLICTGRRIVPRVKIQDHLLTFQCSQRDGISVLIYSFKGRRLISFFQVKHSNELLAASFQPLAKCQQLKADSYLLKFSVYVFSLPARSVTVSLRV